MIEGSVTIGVEQTDVQFLIVHSVMVDNEVLHLDSMRELMKKS